MTHKFILVGDFNTGTYIFQPCWDYHSSEHINSPWSCSNGSDLYFTRPKHSLTRISHVNHKTAISITRRCLFILGYSFAEMEMEMEQFNPILFGDVFFIIWAKVSWHQPLPNRNSFSDWEKSDYYSVKRDYFYPSTRLCNFGAIDSINRRHT